MILKRKTTFFITLGLVLVFGLAACGPVSTTGTPTGTYEPGTNLTPSSPAQTQSLTQQPTTMATMAVTPSVAATNNTTPTMAATENMTPTIEQTQAVTGTPLIPNTGKFDPGRVSNLMKFTVWSNSDKNLGKVDDLIINLTKLQVQYVVVKAQDKDIPVPWSAFKIIGNPPQSQNTNMPQDAMMLNVDQSAFEGAPSFDPTTLPQLGQPANNWDANIQSYWQGILNQSATETPTAAVTGTPEATGTPTTGQALPLQGVVLASKLMGFGIQLGNNAANVSIDDILIDDTTGAIQYVVLHMSSPTIGDRTLPIPLKFFGLSGSNNQSLTINAAITALGNAPVFQNGQYPNTQTPGWDSQIKSYWQNQ